MKRKELNAEKIGPKKYKEANKSLKIEWKKLLAFPSLLLFTVYDILMMEGLFTRLQIRDNIHIFYIYWIVTYGFLFPLLILLISSKLRSGEFLMYSVVGIYCGWLDILFFLLQGKALPNIYTWLPLSPNSLQLVAFATTALVIALFIDFKVKDLNLSIITRNTKARDS